MYPLKFSRITGESLPIGGSMAVPGSILLFLSICHRIIRNIWN